MRGIRYEVDEPSNAMYFCHCSMCRKASGSAFATNMLVVRSSFSLVSGRSLLKWFPSSTSEQRYFCSQCGAPLYSQSNLRANLLSVRCGTLADDPCIRPSEHIHVASKAPWFTILDGVPQFEGEPEP